MKNIFVFTNYDLDGTGSYLVVKWMHPDAHIDCKPVAASKFREEYIKWYSQDNLEKYDRVYILDLDVVQEKDLIDHKNIFVIDHHSTLIDRNAYKNATVVFKEYPSAALLTYKVFKKLYDLKLTNAQKQLILYVNDYDSYALRFKESKILNSYFWGISKAFETFTEEFKDGFKGLTDYHLNVFRLHKKEVKDILLKSQIFECKKLELYGKKYHVISILATKHTDDISAYLLQIYKPDVVFFVNTKNNHISLRRRDKCELDLSEVASDYCDGAGHEYAAGGMITDKFMELSKNFKLIS